MAFISVSINRQQHNNLWKAESAAYLLAIIIHAGVWQIYHNQAKPIHPEEPPIIEVALIVKPKPAPAMQPSAPSSPPPAVATALPKPRVQTPPTPKPVPKVEKPAPQKIVKPRPKPEPKLTPKPEPREETESAPPPEPVLEAPRESHQAPTAPPAPHAAAEGEGRKASKATSGSDEDKQYHPGGISGFKRRYPRAAMERGLEGTVKIKVHILANGEIGEVVVIESSGHDLLDEAAVDMIKEANATPARRGDEPVDSSVIVPYRFTIPK